MKDVEIARYSRHLLLSEIDMAGQEALLDSRVLIVGLGGLGSPVAMYLAASGVGTLVVCDPDQVDIGNLQRRGRRAAPGGGRAGAAAARRGRAAGEPGRRGRT